MFTIVGNFVVNFKKDFQQLGTKADEEGHLSCTVKPYYWVHFESCFCDLIQ